LLEHKKVNRKLKNFKKFTLQKLRKEERKEKCTKENKE
jgi:hypothetical protein